MSKVKICGLKSLDDVSAVNEFLPDYVGFVFAESTRQITPEIAKCLRDQLDDRIEVIGVFVNQKVNFIVDLAQAGIIDHIQLHGDEDSLFIADLRRSFEGKIIKAFGVDDTVPDTIAEVDFMLFDSASLQRGGSGTSFDWSLLQNYAGQPYFLAGGLDSTTVNQALDQLVPYCVDVSSGVETRGIKDRHKIKEFIAAVRKEAR
ncbi:MAG: phosphoribosylanthranilate isomerase [Raoultibacter sp.]|jgi:phosphoribosylanthranilate isomerase